MSVQSPSAVEPHISLEFYVPPRQQLKSAYELIAENPDWGFGQSDIPDFIPTLEGLGRNKFWTLDFNFPRKNKNPGTLMTLLLLAEAINRKTPIFNYNDIYKFFADIRPFNDVDNEPGITWKIIDLSPLNVDENICDQINTVVDEYPAERLATSAVLSAMLLMPGWVASMNGKDVPYILIPGYKVFTCGYHYHTAEWRTGIYICPRGVMKKLVSFAHMMDFGRVDMIHKSKNKLTWVYCLVE